MNYLKFYELSKICKIIHLSISDIQINRLSFPFKGRGTAQRWIGFHKILSSNFESESRPHISPKDKIYKYIYSLLFFFFYFFSYKVTRYIPHNSCHH